MLLLVTVMVVLLLCPLANHFKVKSVTHGAPVVDLNPFDPSGRKRFRHFGEAIAFFGFSCTVFATLLSSALPVSTSSSCSTHRASGWALGWNKTRKLIYTHTVAVRSTVATQIGLVPSRALSKALWPNSGNGSCMACLCI